MKFPMLGVVMAAATLAAGAAQAANYVKLSGDKVDFYYDRDFWTLGATVSGNSISVLTGLVGESVAVSEGAQDPYQGPVFSKALNFEYAYDNSIIAVAHDGYWLNNNITAAADVSLQSTGFSGSSSFTLENVYTRGEYSGGSFVPAGALGTNVEHRYFYFDGYGNGGAGEDNSPIYPGTTRERHQAIAAGGVYYGTAEVTGLGIGSSTLNGINYNFSVTAVPEPDQYALLGAGLALLGCLARRRQRSMP